MLYKIRHYFKNVISRLSIRQKMLIALITCIIIPMVLLGLYTALRVIDLSAQNQYEAQISQLTKSAKELENLYTMAEQEAQSLAYDSSVQAIAEGSASVMDYRTASERMTAASDKIDYCSCIAVIRDGKILFQRGEQYLSEVSSSGQEQTQPLSKWESSSNVFFERGIHSFLLDEIIYETTILQDMTYNKQGTVRIYLDVSQILEAIAPTGAEGETAIQNVLVCTPDGKILFEKETESRDGEQFIHLLESQDRLYSSGYFSVSATSRQMVLYARCETGGWYLVQTMDKLNIYDTQLLYILGVLFFCIVFGVVYGMIQNKTILNPLQRLSHRINIVKSGVLEKESYETAYDEIGNVERGFEDMVSHINDLINQVYLQTIKTKDAEREMLLAKMNPHFLYNALDSIHWLAYQNKDYEVSEQLEALADIYRHILQFDKNIISVRQEVAFIENYLFLLECQMGDRIDFVLDIPESLYTCRIPKLLLQPLIENSVNHGLKDVRQGGKVKIRMRRKAKDLEIVILDNGIGCDSKKLMELIQSGTGHTAFALRNISERIRLTYGDGYGLTIYSKKNWGCMVKIKIKIEEESNEANDCG